jgi:membrane protein DedA with SNARE-associated domain
MDNLLNTIEHFWLILQTGQVPHWGFRNYLLLIPLIMVEGPIATTLAAVAASAGYLNVKAVFIVAAFSNLLADLLWYSVGYAGKTEWALRLGRPFGLRQRHLNLVQHGFSEQAPRLLVLAKLTSAFTIPMLIAAGLSKLPFKRWLPSYIVAEAIWTGLLVVIGYHATTALLHINQGLQSLGIASAAIFAVIAIVVLRHAIQSRQAIAATTSQAGIVSNDS